MNYFLNYDEIDLIFVTLNCRDVRSRVYNLKIVLLLWCVQKTTTSNHVFILFEDNVCLIYKHR